MVKMINEETNWWREFFCNGGECPFTCCGGWNIGLSGEEIETYRRFSEIIPDIMEHIDEENMCMRQREGHCTLLTSDGWCRLVRDYGDVAISATCQLYPRIGKEYGNVIEHTVAISCPFVAKFMLGTCHLEVMRNEKGEYTDVLYRVLLPYREYLLSVLKGDMCLAGKVFLTLQIAKRAKQIVSLGDDLMLVNQEDEIKGWEEKETEIHNEMCALEKNYTLKAQMVLMVFSLYGGFLKTYFDKQNEGLAPELLEDIEVWSNQTETLQNDLRQAKEFLTAKYPLFETTYLEQMVFLAFIQNDERNYEGDFFFRYIELVLLRIFVMSRLRHHRQMDTVAFSSLISRFDRKMYYSAEARNYVANTVIELDKGGRLDLFMLPAY